MGEVIPLFKQEPDPHEPFVVEDVLNDELRDELHEVMVLIEEFFGATSERCLLDRIAEVKGKVARWPGASDG
jgi:hypothetical protein